MDLKQEKLKINEWEYLEKPIDKNEKEILNFIYNSYENVDFNYNKNISLLNYLKLKNNENYNSYFYKNFFDNEFKNIYKLIKLKPIKIKYSKNNFKKADKIRINNSKDKILNVKSKIYEYILIKFLTKNIKNKNIEYNYYTLNKLIKYNISNVNPYVIDNIKYILNFYKPKIKIKNIIKNSLNIIEKNKYIFASEMKMISCFTKNEIKQFTPGCFKTIKNGIAVEEKFSIVSPLEINFTLEESLKLVKKSFINAVIKRVTSTDREIACLLSGGLDSSLVSAIVAKQLTPTKLHTYSIGMKGSTDLKHAKIAAEFIGTIHHSIELSSEDFLRAIENVIYVIESYDVTSVRASVGNWLISKYISENSNSKVIFNGDGADECCGGYIYMSQAPNSLEFDKECRRLLENIHFYDVLRSDRCISSNGLEPRTPFLDRSFVNTYLSIPVEFRFTGVGNEKKLLRDSFADSGLLPDDILYRRKEAFSDGVSSVDESWYTVISNHIEKNKLAKNEKEYYKFVYETCYGKQKCVPEPWMPKFIKSSDPSARTLTSIY